MSKVKVNDAEFQEVQTHVDLAKKEIEEAMDDVWSTNFSNLYHNFVTNGFLHDLYKDAESKYNLLFGTGTGIICGVGAAYAGTAAATGATAVTVASVSFCIPVAGWIIGAIILAIIAAVGIYHMIKSASDVQFKHDAENAFVDLLEECETCNQMNYLATENVETKLENIRLSMQKILFKIEEYNTMYASFTEAAESVNLADKIQTEDGVLVGIKTDVTINGQKVEMTTSEAMSAFYTYTETVMNAEIAADYLERTYGYDINYMDIVNNANAFMVNTITSGLYTHEFIDVILPEYTPSYDEALNAITGATGVDLDKIQSTLNNNVSIAGSVALFGGLLGTALLGNLGTSGGAGGSGGSGGTGGSGGSGGSGGPGGSGGSGGTGGSGGGSGITTTPTETEQDPEPPVEENPPVEEPAEPEPQNNIEIDPVVETEIPDEIEFELNPDGEVDYDQLARDEYEFDQDYEEIVKRRTEIIDDIENKFASGDLESIKDELKEYGYSSAEIEAIIQDKQKTIKAILDGDQNAILAKRAVELAKADGVENYDTKYDDRPIYDDLAGEGPKDSLMVAAEDPNIVKVKEAMDESKEKYEQSVVGASAIIATVHENEKIMNDIKAKYEAQYGVDTKMWTEEAAKEYNESVKTYNTSVAQAEEEIKKVEENKKSYSEARKAFVDAKEEYYKKTKEDFEKVTMTPTLEEGSDTDVLSPDGQPGVGEGQVLGESTYTSEDGVLSLTPDVVTPDPTVIPENPGSPDGVLPADTVGITYLD